MTIPIQAAFSGGDLPLPGLDSVGKASQNGAAGASGATSPVGGFASALRDKIGQLDASQNAGAAASQAIATGQSTDIAQTMLKVQQASISLQLATQIRNKAVQAYQDVMQMQV